MLEQHFREELVHRLAECDLVKLYGLANVQGMTLQERLKVEQPILDYYWNELEHYGLERLVVSEENKYPEREPIEWNPEHHQLWTLAARRQQVVNIVYESSTSGLAERLVDPYQTKFPYIYGYCHVRQSIRQFRLDRMHSIELTDRHFTKPDNWREVLDQERKKFIDNILNNFDQTKH